MKIFQLILSDTISSNLRYANELYNGIIRYFKEYEISTYTITDNSILSQELIDKINSYDYLFIHNLRYDKNQYIQLYELITCKKILFITDQNIKKFLSDINKEYIKHLLLSCYKIVLNKNIEGFTETILNLTKNQYSSENLIQLDYIYNADYSVLDIPKYKEIIQVSNKGLNSKYDLFIKLFENRQDYFKDFIWKIYGCEKNIQTLSIDKLYFDKKTNQPSDITDFNTKQISKNKINIYPLIGNKKLKDIIFNTYFVCCFDNYQYINYTILDIIYSGTIPILNIKYAKNIKINDKQSIYDIINGIYINDKELITNDILISMNKYFQSFNTYQALAQRNIKKCDQLFNPQKNITKLFNNLYE